MVDFLLNYYDWIKALHLIAVISWLAGLFYLPRLYVYHTETEKGSAQSETFKIMERRLLRAIMNPAMIATWFLGFTLFYVNFDAFRTAGWLHWKIMLVLALSVFHMMLAKYRKDFERDQNRKTAKFYRIANEVPTLLMVVIIILVIVKPF